MTTSDIKRPDLHAVVIDLGELAPPLYLPIPLPIESCGGEQFLQPENASLEDEITCAGCGQTFQAKELARVRAVEEAKKIALEKIRGAFGKK